MHIYIDESGSFVPTANPGAWSTVAAFVVSEAQRRPMEDMLRLTKLENGFSSAEEIKLRNFSDQSYLAFLHRLRACAGLLFCTSTDAGIAEEFVTRHHKGQLERLNENIPRVRHPTGRAGYQHVADRFSELSPQLYLQMICQYDVVMQVVTRGMLFLVQRVPSALARFRWKIDQKHEGRSVFDESFRALAPAFLQSYSLSHPQPMLIGADYSHFERFRFADGPPTYLRDEYGLEVGDGFNIRLVLSENFAFVDSKSSSGVQVVDLLASGLRRCLRNGFSNNDEVAVALGSLMVESSGGSPPIDLVTVMPSGPASDEVAHAVTLMRDACRPMLL